MNEIDLEEKEQNTKSKSRRIHLEIGEIILHGFDYHDYRRIGTAIEQELARLISDYGLKGLIVSSAHASENHSENQSDIVDVGSFDAPMDMNPRTIGTRAARSIYRGLEASQHSLTTK
jgi:hypothetical protein